MPALEKRIAEYQALYGDLRSVAWVIYSDLVISTHKDGADEAILELLRDQDVLHGMIAAIRRRSKSQSDAGEQGVPLVDGDIGVRAAGNGSAHVEETPEGISRVGRSFSVPSLEH